MKKTVLLLVALLTCTIMQAQEYTPGESINFSIQCLGFDPKPIGVPLPKSPNNPPVVYQEDNVLYFVGDHSSYTLILRDEDGELVYSTFVSSTTTSVILPAWLEGDYELQLYPTGLNYYFYGWIEL